MTRLISLLVLLCVSMAAAAEPVSRSADEPRIGLVLSGGGARGLAHIGVLRALEEHHIRITAIAGTSMGAIVGALYASGKTPDELEEIALRMNWSQPLSDQPARRRLSFRRKQDSLYNPIRAEAAINEQGIRLPKGVVQGQNLQTTLQQQFLHISHITHFDQLNIPFRAIASDLVTGEAYVFDRGSMATAIRASMTIPGLFAPVELDGKVLVDGGIANNLPVDVVKTMDVDYVIAVDIATPLYNARELDSVIPIIEQLTTLLTFNRQKSQYALLGDDDLLITPDLHDISTTDFDKINITIQRGYDAMLAAAEKLDRYQSRQWTPRSLELSFVPPVVNAIEIVNDTNVSDELIKAQLHQKVGQPLDVEQLRSDIDSIYGYDYFEAVNYELTPGPEGDTLRVTATRRPLGQNELGLTAEIYSDTRADTHYNLGASFRKMGITAKGGEWLTRIQLGQDPSAYTELYLPLDYEQRLFLNPYARYTEANHNLVVGGAITSQYSINDTIYGIIIGTEVSNKTILSIGAAHRFGGIDAVIGTSSPLPAHFSQNLISAVAEYDTLDSLAFPSQGTRARVQREHIIPSGMDPAFNLTRATVTRAIALGVHAIVFDIRYESSTSSLAGRQDQGSLGGLKRLSGIHRDALVGSEVRYASVAYLRRLSADGPLPVNFPVYVGLALEAGNVWQDSDKVDLGDLVYAATLLLGIDTPIGPLYLGYGRTDTNHNGLYLQLGHLF